MIYAHTFGKHIDAPAIGVFIFGALILYLVTRGLLLVLPEMRPWSVEEMIE